MLVAHLGRNGAARKEFGVDRIAARVVAADALDREFAGLPADVGGHNAVRHHKARIRLALMHLLHNLPPDILVDGIAAVAVRERLVVVATAPDARRIVGREAHKPDIHVVARGAGLAGAAHVRGLGACARRIDIDAAARKFAVRQHGLLQRIRQQKGGRVLDHAVLLRVILEEHFAVVIQNFGVEHRLRVDTLVCDCRKGRRELQVVDALGEAAERHGRVIVRVREARDAELLAVLRTELRAHGFHEAAHRDNVHRVHDAVADAGPAEIVVVAVPVPELLAVCLIGAVVVDGAERLPAGIDGRRKRGQDLEGRTRLPVGIRRTV